MKKITALSLSVLFMCFASAYALPPEVANWGLAWSDEFEGTSLDTVNNWSYDTGAVYNAEQEKYKRACVEVSNGRLIIWSKLNMYGETYPSGRIDTHDKQIFTYGYFEAAIQGPIGTGANGPALWSAVWLLGNSINHGVAWPTCGEMELYEQRTGPQDEGGSCAPSAPGDNLFIGTCHYGVGGGPSYHSCAYNNGSCLCGGFHKYGILWDPSFVKYYFDDKLYWGPDFPAGCGTPSITTPDNQVAFSSPFYWIINSAVGGNYQGQNILNSIFPLHMDLDYVRVYQKDAPVVKNPRAQHTPQAWALVNPSTAQLKVYNLSGKLVADYTSKVRQMKAGDNAIKMMPATLSNGAYMVRLVDNGNTVSQRLIFAR